MKKLYFPLVLLLGLSGLNAQSPRMVMAEAFSNASCPPCASQNPAYNTLLNQNAGTVVSVKYQTNWPGVDPMNAQNPTEVAARVSYYGVTGVPWGNLDGTAHAGANYLGALANMTQSSINARAAVLSPFTMNLSHTLSQALDSATVSLDLICTEALDVGSQEIRVHILLVEREINFATPPGTTNEKDFKSVMRKMVPNAQGTVVSSSWVVGGSQNWNITIPVPSYIYKPTELAFVAFVQNHSTKEVYQAGYSAPQPIADYGVISAVNTNSTGVNCVGELNNATATINNLGSTALTSATVHYQVNGMVAQNFPFTGSISPGATGTVNIPAITGIPGGNRTLTVWLTDINNPGAGQTVQVGTGSVNFSVSGAPVSTPFSEAFEAASMPANWIISNSAANGWSRVQGASGFGTGSRSMRCFFWNMSANTTADLISSRFDMTQAGNNTSLKFDVAYTYWSAASPENDRLRVDYSTNCGGSWTNLFEKGGTALSTAPPLGSNSNPFVPNASQWRTESIDVGSLLSQGDVLFRFRGISAFGDNLYLDNVRLEAPASTSIIDLVDGTSMQLFPNPSNTESTLLITLTESTDLDVSVYSITGQELMSIPMQGYVAGSHSLSIPTLGLPNGVYLVRIGNADVSQTLRLVVQH